MVSEELVRISAIEGREELTDYIVYKKLSQKESGSRERGIFSRLSKVEYGHYKFWKKYSDAEMRPSKLKIWFVLFLRRLFGTAFVIKYLECGEASVIKKYRSLARFVPKRDRKRFERIIEDEEGHEKEFAERIQGAYVRYISFIVLGLADAIVEIAGIHAGSLGIYNSTELTGLAGVIAGAAASIAMASAAFAQAKQGFEGSPSRAAGYTGVSYFISAVILATPYFLTRIMADAMLASIILGTLIIAFVSWYNSIVSGSRFKRDFAELAAVMFGATVALFMLGLGVRHLFRITI